MHRNPKIRFLHTLDKCLLDVLHTTPTVPRTRLHSRSPSNRFYENRILEQYAAKPTTTVTLRQLTIFGRALTKEKILRSANYVREELAVRLAHRIMRFQQLPFVVGANPHIENVYQLYWNAFETFRTFPSIESLDQNDRFCELVSKMLDVHMTAIPHLAMGIAESDQHLTPSTADRFMNETLRSRIGRRVLAEQHIALSRELSPFLQKVLAPPGLEKGRPDEQETWIGVVNTRCRAYEIVETCTRMATDWFKNVYGAQPPPVIVDGYRATTFTYIPEHLEYILVELLKNSFRSTFDQHSTMDRVSSLPESASSNNTNNLPPIHVTIGQADSTIMFRVSDHGGGIPKEISPHIWSYSHPSKKKWLNFNEMPTKWGARIGETTELPPHLQLGLGLPMARVYAEYWGGTISIYSMDGYGTDVYVTISIGNQAENLEYQEPR